MPETSKAEKDAQARCDRILEGLRAARYGKWVTPAHDADPNDVHKALLDMRERMDKAAVLMSELRRYKHEVHSQARMAAAAADEVYDTELDRLSKRAVTREYESIRDREVQARMKAIEKRQAANRMQRLADIADAAWDEAQAVFFSMRDVRGELIVTLDKFLPWLKSMET